MQITDLQEQIHQLAKEKGWWDTEVNIPEKLALIHSEISEALEDYRVGNMNEKGGADLDAESDKPHGFYIELADAVIRIMDLMGYYGLNLEYYIILKHHYNHNRSYRHGNKNC